MRKPISTSVPQELVTQIDDFVKSSKGSYKDRSHLVEQALMFFLGENLSLHESVSRAVSSGQNQDISSSMYETSLFPRLAMNTCEKKAIANLTANLIERGKTLFIDGSTTCIELAKVLTTQRKGLTIVTNSTLICMELGHNREHKIIGVGGDYDSTSASFIGCDCEESVKRFYVDFAIFSTKGFIPDEGTFESTMGTLRVKQAVSQNCAKVILLVDHTKFNQKSMCKVLDISQIHTVITDDQAPGASIDLLRQNGHEVHIVALESSKNRGESNVFKASS